MAMALWVAGLLWPGNKGIFLDIEVFRAAPSRGGISRRLLSCWSADYLCVRVSIVWIIRCQGVKPVSNLELLHYDLGT